MKKILKLFISIMPLFILSSCSIKTIFNDSFIALGTVIDITIYNDSNSQSHYNDIKKIMLDISNVSNQYEILSDKTYSIYNLNKERIIYNKDNNTYYSLLSDLLNVSFEIKDKTNGYFNPFIGNLSNKWKTFIESGNAINYPKSDEINYLLDEMNSSSIEINDEYITIKGDACIDLGAIAKGYAVSKALDYLKDNNVSNFIINAGQSNISFGVKPNNKYTIQLTDFNTKLKVFNTIGIVKGNNNNITTSAMGEQSIYYNNSYIHHIISPITGYPMSYYSTVLVFEEDPMYADPYTTAIFSMDIDTAKQFIKDNNLSSILYSNIDDKGLLYKSDLVGDYFNEA